jgi:phage-related protein
MSGAGTLTVNGKTWSIGAYTGTLYCDTDIMDWYNSSSLQNDLVSGSDFPELQPGENIIYYTGGITKVKVTPRWRAL